MAKHLPAAARYYFADGDKIELTPAEDLVAVEGGHGPKLGLAGRLLTDGLRLVSREELGPTEKGLAESKPKYPVFRSHGAIVVALPEVRVEESRKPQQAQIQEWLTEHRGDVEVISQEGERFILRPVSNSGVDALVLANQLTKEVGPEMVQPRFIRVVPRAGS